MLEHLSEPERTLAQIRDALVPEGRLLISVPNVANIYVRLNLLFGCFPYAERGILDRTHRVFFTRHSLTKLVEGHGFRVERETISTIPLPLALPWLPRPLLVSLGWGLDGLTRILPTLLGYQIILAARRL